MSKRFRLFASSSRVEHPDLGFGFYAINGFPAERLAFLLRNSICEHQSFFGVMLVSELIVVIVKYQFHECFQITAFFSKKGWRKNYGEIREKFAGIFWEDG
ncbi:MAG: hypothetical protein NTZ73_00260 [Candidatus Diapherotrites archaeon]|nr:hypothetical protein [Candidatus Diapherotrites archaeon]